MGIGADDAVAGDRQSLFGDQGVLHPYGAHIKEIFDFVLAGKRARCGAELCRFDILTGGVVIQHEGNFVFVKHFGESCVLKYADGHRRGNIVAQHQIQFALDQLPGLHTIKPGVVGQDLLAHCHSHEIVPFFHSLRKVYLYYATFHCNRM